MEIKSTAGIVKWFEYIEQNYPVASWRIGDVLYWPIIRNDLYLKLSNAVLAATSGKNYKAKKSNPLVNLWYSNKRLLEAVSAPSRFLKNTQEANTLTFSAFSHRTLFNGQFWNRYVDALYDNDKLGNNYIFEYHTITDSVFNQYYKKERVIALYKAYPLFNTKAKWIKLFQFSSIDHELVGYDKFLGEIRKQPLIAKQVKRYEVKSLLDRHRNFLVMARFYKKLLEKAQPKKVFLLCYYTTNLYPLIHVANQLGIDTIDIQHGGQGAEHLAYTNWLQWPDDKKYSCLPKLFWVWDEVAKWNIQNNFEAQQIHYHTAFVGGNPWIDFLKTVDISSVNLPENIILYSLQPYGKLLEDEIVTAIKNCPPHFHWYLRLHPRQLHQKQVLLDFLKVNGIHHLVNIEDATSMQLPILLRKAKLHITRSSGAAVEASLMGVKNLIMDEAGKEMYSKEIESNELYVYIEQVILDLNKFIYGE
ncbi:MAG: hypothetical protein ACK4HE_03295 [Chitinophagaceae bacterium]